MRSGDVVERVVWGLLFGVAMLASTGTKAATVASSSLAQQPPASETADPAPLIARNTVTVRSTPVPRSRTTQ